MGAGSLALAEPAARGLSSGPRSCGAGIVRRVKVGH